jgi:hypothetical protein
MQAALHRRADRFERDPPPGLTLVRRYDSGMFICPLECGGAYTTLVYSADGLDPGQLCALAEVKLTELFGPPRYESGYSPGQCRTSNGWEAWPLPGVYENDTSVTALVVPPPTGGASGRGPTLTVRFDSGRR